MIAILIILLSSESRPLPKCSLPCSKTGTITSDDFCWYVSISNEGWSPNEAPGLIATLGQLTSSQHICIRIGLLPSEVDTRQQSSSEMMITVLELLTLGLHFGKGHVSELNILNNTCQIHP